jgi:methionine biosynthesis protein MetW
MPVSDLLPYAWYSTPNIHFCTVKDFETLCCERNITIVNSTMINNNRETTYCRNLLGETAIYHLTR